VSATVSLVMDPRDYLVFRTVKIARERFSIESCRPIAARLIRRTPSGMRPCRRGCWW
jgi:hypothetical protein